MNTLSIIFSILGLCLFEIISSIDNAVINAEVLSTMGPRGRKWFLLWGMLFAVFVVRGVLPWLIVWASIPSIGILEAFTASFSSDPKIIESIETTAPILLASGGVFLIFLFFHWLFIEPKNFGLPGEKFFSQQGAWFFAMASLILTTLVWFAMQQSPMKAFGLVVGSTAFFITHGFKQYAEQQEKKLIKSNNMSDLSKILYLEVIDTTFSIDGVLGAFAFTLSVPIILLGNSLGAFVLREITIHNIERIKKLIFLKNGAMYSVLILGTIMLAESFSVHIPKWVTPLTTFMIVGFFLRKSLQNAKLSNETSSHKQ